MNYLTRCIFLSDTETSVESIRFDGKAEEYRRSRSRNMIDRTLSSMGAGFDEFRQQEFRSIHTEARDCWFVLWCFLINNALKMKNEDNDIIWQVTKPLTMSESEFCCRAYLLDTYRFATLRCNVRCNISCSVRATQCWSKLTGIWYFCEILFTIISNFSNFHCKRKLFFFSSRKHLVYRVLQKVLKLLSLT